MERGREGDRNTQTDRQIDKGRETERQAGRQEGRLKDKDGGWEGDRKTEIDTVRESEETETNGQRQKDRQAG